MSDAKLLSVVDKLPKPVVVPAVTNASMAAGIRKLADEVEAGEFGDAAVLLAVIEGANGSLSRALVGERLTKSRAIGLLHWSAHRLMDGK